MTDPTAARAERVALVTGAGRGLGRAIAVGFASEGSTVVVVARSSDELATAAAEIRAAGGTAHVAIADVRNADDVDSVVAGALGACGRIDVLVNAAGTSPFYKRSENLTPSEWDLVIETNLRGTFLFCRAVGSHMLGRRSGSIINVSSVAGATSGLARLAAYSASKAGIEGLTKALAVEWADRGVRVNAIAPAFFKTQLTQDLLASPHASVLLARTPLGRFGEPHEIVSAALFLASKGASYVTGSTLLVDGGWQAG